MKSLHSYWKYLIKKQKRKKKELTLLLTGPRQYCGCGLKRASWKHKLRWKRLMKARKISSKERGIKYQFIDMKEKGMSKGEFTSVAQANGGIENMINQDCKDKDVLALIKYIAEEDKLEKILENPQVIKTPVVRNGKQSTFGYMPEVWKSWN